MPGKTHYIADALSRAPLFEASDLNDMTIDSARTCVAVTDPRQLDMILDSIDSEYRALRSDVLSGKRSSHMSSHLKSIFDQLSTDGDWCTWTARKR